LAILKPFFRIKAPQHQFNREGKEMKRKMESSTKVTGDGCGGRYTNTHLGANYRGVPRQNSELALNQGVGEPILAEVQYKNGTMSLLLTYCQFYVRTDQIG